MSWALLLSYELEIRSKAYRLMGEDGVDLVTALKQAMIDPVVKDRYFTMPLKMGPAGRRSSTFVVADPPSDRQQDRQQDQAQGRDL